MISGKGNGFVREKGEEASVFKRHLNSSRWPRVNEQEQLESQFDLL